MTNPMTLRGWRVTIDVPRYRWELGTVNGDDCLVPRERLVGQRFRGGREAFAVPFDPNASADDILVFANAHTGLFADGDEPAAERLGDWRAEAVVLDLLPKIRAMRLVDIEVQRWSGRSPRVKRRGGDPQEWMASTARHLAALLPEMRPGHGVAGEAAGFDPEAVGLAWVNATLEAHAVVRVPLADWTSRPMVHRSSSLAPVEPVLTCRTLLGYLHAGVLVHYDWTAQWLARSQAGELPGIDDLTGRCQRCGIELARAHLDGRKVRRDTRWCYDCARRENTEAQRRRRARVPNSGNDAA